jgi:putative ABC transport system substrate-binding protein
MKGRHRRLGLACLAAVMVATTYFSHSENSMAQSDRPRIAIVYTSPHPVLNDAIAGFREAVRKVFPNADFVERHANGRPEEYETAVLAAISTRPAILAPITTPITSIAIKQARGSLPIVFIAITDPVGARVVDSLEHPRISTGSSDLCPFSTLLATARQILPNAKVLGLPYNPSDQPAVFGRAQLLKLAPQYGFSIVDRQVSAASELGTEVRGLASRTDGIIISSDNLMMENPAAVSSAAAIEGKPTFACDSASVRAGAVAGVNIDYREVGMLAGELAVKVLRGAKPGDLPVAVLNKGGLALNLRAACTVHIEIPATIVSQASDIAERNYQCAKR